jgi:tetraacyldisaccharide 4'-kinase
MNRTSAARLLLFPLIPLYRLALLLRDIQLRTGLKPVRQLQFPVVSVGNLSTGGSGKTPLTIALAKALTRRGLRVVVLSRGYGRTSELAARVRVDGSVEEFGDEPLLIARDAEIPVYVAPQRYNAGLLAEADAHTTAQCPIHSRSVRMGGTPQTSTADENNQSSVHLLDDGFQHRHLARTVDILLLNEHDWDDWLLPAGNLREPCSAIRRASVIAIPAEEPDLESRLRVWGWQGPVWKLRRTMKILGVAGPIAAFCGIARPAQFFAGLEATDYHLTMRTAFPDHHCYTAQDLDQLVSAARATNAAALVTTEKDLVRLGPLVSHIPESMPLKTARLRVEIENQGAAIDWLMDRLGIASAHPPL